VELARVNQSVTGSRDELRKRLTDFVKTHPEQFVGIDTIYQLSTTVLKEELKELGYLLMENGTTWHAD
jgi:hypothetical protein